jgi:hypothetical protein
MTPDWPVTATDTFAAAVLRPCGSNANVAVADDMVASVLEHTALVTPAAHWRSGPGSARFAALEPSQKAAPDFRQSRIQRQRDPAGGGGYADMAPPGAAALRATQRGLDLVLHAALFEDAGEIEPADGEDGDADDDQQRHLPISVKPLHASDSPDGRRSTPREEKGRRGRPFRPRLTQATIRVRRWRSRQNRPPCFPANA